MKTIMILMLGLIVSTASLAKTDKETSPSSAVKTRLTVRGSSIELAIQKQDANASVELLDASNQVLYKFRYNIKKGISQRFDVSQLTPGNYRITIEVQKEKIVKEFAIRSASESQTIYVKG